jgi:hypothetical protein
MAGGRRSQEPGSQCHRLGTPATGRTALIQQLIIGFDWKTRGIRRDVKNRIQMSEIEKGKISKI